MMKNNILISMLSLISVSLISGCNGSKGDLDDYFEAERAKPAEPIDPIPEVKPYLRYPYPGHEVDPFDVSVLIPDIPTQPIVDPEKPGDAILPDINRPPEFLESFPLDSLRMVGTVEKDNTKWALIRIPEGSVETVKKGNYLGQNYGEIMDISDVKMEMIETVSNGLGGYELKEISITLNQE